MEQPTDALLDPGVDAETGQPDPNRTPPVTRDVLATAALGLEPSATPRRDVVVIGGGWRAWWPRTS
ncbi:MAG: hypothetical protein LH650_08185 [Chloroflexi bacterium]|nr:hypothetical protein [Chloroflexota bacterium]